MITMPRNLEEFLRCACEASVNSELVRQRVVQASMNCLKLVNKAERSKQSVDLTDAWARKEEAEDQELQAIRYELKCYHEVNTFISSLPEGAIRTVMRRRFLDGPLSWRQIAKSLRKDGIYLSERTIHRIFNAGKAAAQELWIEAGKENTLE